MSTEKAASPVELALLIRELLDRCVTLGVVGLSSECDEEAAALSDAADVWLDITGRKHWTQRGFPPASRYYRLAVPVGMKNMTRTKIRNRKSRNERGLCGVPGCENALHAGHISIETVAICRMHGHKWFPDWVEAPE